MGFPLTQQLYLAETPFLQPPLVNCFLSEDSELPAFSSFRSLSRCHHMGGSLCYSVVNVALSLWSWAIFPRLVFF